MNTSKNIFHDLRTNWKDKLTGNKVDSCEDTDYRNCMMVLEDHAREVWELLDVTEVDKNVSREIFKEYDTKNESSHITKSFRNIALLARAYASKGCGLYKNEKLKIDIIQALDWMHTYRYHKNLEGIYKNWWDWNIGAPQALCDSLILMYEELTYQQIENYVHAIDRITPTPWEALGGPGMTGANLLDTALVGALKGILIDREKDMVEARDAISDTLPYVEKSDGFYKDGSFVQHYVIPYAGGYGGVLMGCMAKLLYILDGTPWKVTDPLIENVYDWILNSFAPLYYKGAIMDMSSGRGITRYGSNDHIRGKVIIPEMLQLSHTAPAHKQQKIWQFLKENIEADCNEHYLSELNVNDMLNVKRLLSDDAVQAKREVPLFKMFAAMDRAVYHNPKYAVAISMYSTRMASFEYGNGENKKGWHTSDGVVALYNEDVTQYSENYWATTDMMRLPGITTDHTDGELRPWHAHFSTQDWVGGVSLKDQQGSVGMSFETERSSLSGKKSWFCIGDEVVCLGAGIQAQDNLEVETIIENRRVEKMSTQQIWIDNQQYCEALDTRTEVKEASWAYLQGETEGKSIGYYFPEKAVVDVRREQRTGSWKEVNDGGPEELVTDEYVSLAIPHGINPEQATYAYVMIPGCSKKELMQVEQASETTVLMNTSHIQSIKNDTLGLLGIHFWEAGKLQEVEALQPCAVMIQEDDNSFQVAVSDPTQQQVEIKLILANKTYQKITHQEETIEVEQKPEGLVIRIKTIKTAGKTHTISFHK